MLRLLTFLICLLTLLENPTLAQSIYFNFKTDDVFTADKKINVNFQYNIGSMQPSRFLIRPRSDKGVLLIKHQSGDYVFKAALMSELPYLEEETNIIIKSLNGNYVTIWFEIIDSITQEVYETPKKTLINSEYKGEYLSSLKINLLKYDNDGENILDIKPDVFKNSIDKKFIFFFLKIIAGSILISLIFYEVIKYRGEKT